MRVLTGLAVCLGCLSAAFAQNSGGKDEQAACRPDVRKYCAHLGQGDERKYQECLQSHFQQLSQKCQEVLMSHKGQN